MSPDNVLSAWTPYLHRLKQKVPAVTVDLFIPCYIDQFYPQVGIATLSLLQKLGVSVRVPAGQTCCGQPMANAGFAHLSEGCHVRIAQQFANATYVVVPSGSCALHLREYLPELAPRIYELAAFLTDVLEVQTLHAHFPHRVGLHQSCHGQRGLGLSQMSELVAPPFSKTASLLQHVKGLELIQLSRVDECCGFGGTFCVSEEAVSAKMGKDRVADHLQHGAAYITGNDMSCLMHLEGILKRQGSTTKVIHLAEILNAG